MNNNHDIVPPHLIVKAMRDSGYKNAAYAIAELMDNSVQAEASSVELLCGQRHNDATNRYNIYKIAVLDNGLGMDSDVLRMALAFGNGMHLEADQQDGIGKFGMGLPNSSISQCTRVDVWSWQDGYENALWTYIDVNKIANRALSQVPKPEPKAIPDIWLEVGKTFGLSGTLVVWSNLDRIMWKTAKAVIKNSEFLIGRMYRRYLSNRTLSIRFVDFDFDKPNEGLTESYARANDPGYLMPETSCPTPWHDRPMFDPWGEPHEIIHTINYNGANHDVIIRFSIAKSEARPGRNPGALPHGQHARKNVGLSIVRANRELELDPAWAIRYEPTERWWGIELEFPPSLDDIFGVTNNKQSARNLADLAALTIEDILDGRSMQELKADWEATEDPRGPLLDLVNLIEKRRNTMRRVLKAQKSTRPSSGGDKRHTENSTEKRATDATQERKQETGPRGETDKDEDKPAEERQREIQSTLEDEFFDPENAKLLAATTVENNLKYIFQPADLETPSFFSVRLKGGAIIILLNTNHPAYRNLVELLEEDTEEQDSEKLRDRLIRARDGLELLLMAWARFEDEQPDSRRKDIHKVRWEWGQIAQAFLDQES